MSPTDGRYLRECGSAYAVGPSEAERGRCAGPAAARPGARAAVRTGRPARVQVLVVLGNRAVFVSERVLERVNRGWVPQAGKWDRSLGSN